MSSLEEQQLSEEQQQSSEAPSSGATDETSSAVSTGVSNDALREQVLEALKVVHDPEIPVNIVDLGLVYKVEVRGDGHVDIDMTLTSLGCPVQDLIQTDTELAAMKVDGVNSVAVEFVWSPAWSLAKMTEDGKRQMRMFGFNV